MCLRATGLQFFQICHCAELNKIVEATMPVNPYDDRKVSLRRPQGNGDLDIVRASYTRRKANVTQALQRPCGYRTTAARLLCSHRVIFTTSPYKSHDARTMGLRKSQGVGTLTTQLSCKYVHGFKRPSMFIFGCTFEPCFKVM